MTNDQIKLIITQNSNYIDLIESSITDQLARYGLVGDSRLHGVIRSIGQQNRFLEGQLNETTTVQK